MNDLDAIRARANSYASAYMESGWRDAAWQASQSADDVPDLIAEVEHLRTRRGYASQRLDKARAAAEVLLRKEQQRNGSGRDGHLDEADLVPLFEALGAVHLDGPDPQVFVSSDGDPE